MSKIAEYFTKIISRHLNNYGIIVWYDPENLYAELLDRIQIPEVPIFKYQDSFLKLRQQIEPYLSGEDRPQLLIYLPLERSKVEYALVEAEAAGNYLMPEHPEPEFNTSLEHIAFQVLKPIIPGKIEHILNKIQRKELTCSDVDQIASSSYKLTTGTLTLLFDRSDPVEILLNFLTQPSKDNEISRKNVFGEIQQLVRQQLGIDVSNINDINELRKYLWRLVLLNEIVLEAKLNSQLPESLTEIPLVNSETAGNVVLNLAQSLRQRAPIHEMYRQWADQVEKEFSVSDWTISAAVMEHSQTFSAIEEKLIRHALQQFLKKPSQPLKTFIEQRRQTFWGNLPPFNIFWDWLHTAVDLWLAGDGILKDLRKHKTRLDNLIKRYTSDEDGWYRLDQLFQEFEIGAEQLEPGFIAEQDLFDKAWAKGRQRYSTVLRELAERFQENFDQVEIDGRTAIWQREIFSRRVAPALKKRQKIAYLLVDALRYEMGAKLKHLLQDTVEIDLFPSIVQLPGVTTVGMAALMPDAENFMAISTSKKGDWGIEINGHFLRTRKDRIHYLTEYLNGVAFFETRLDKVRKPSKTVREKISNAKFILVTSQEIDQLGESIDAGIARQMMDHMLIDLRHAILELLKSGVDKIFVTSDHGYLFGEELDPGDKIDAPGGKTVSLHRRVWLGHGGVKHSSYIRLTESQVGLSGEWELVFPRGIAGFKSQGGNEVYFHGGVSLQEMIVPLLVIEAEAQKTSRGGKAEVQLRIEKTAITNRFFTLQAEYR